jgi:hypothetical protein
LDGPVLGVCVAGGGFAYLGDWNELWIVDAIDPENPHVASTPDIPGKVEKIVLRDDYVFRVCSDSGLRIANVSDPYAPYESGFFAPPGQASSVCLWNHFAYVADRNDGLYILQNDLVNEAPGYDLPEVTSLQGVYPNPFNPQMSVSFPLAQPARVNLAVFDLAGSQVAVITDRMFGSGSHSVPWNGRDASGQGVSSGVYVVQMEAAGLRESQKVTLLC